MSFEYYNNLFSNHNSNPFAGFNNNRHCDTFNILNQGIDDLSRCVEELDLENLQLNSPTWTPTSLKSQEEEVIRAHSEMVIGGFLNLGNKEGWPDSGYHSVGSAFTRFILEGYLQNYGSSLSTNKPVLETVLKGFQKSGVLDRSESHQPKKSRICFDGGIHGWQEHALGRMVGNLGSEYSSKKPFFEILINSSRKSPEDFTCQPFFISIHTNEQVLNERRKNLGSLNMAPGKVAHWIFYSKSLTSPKDFLELNKERMGPNGTRMLHALIYLQDVTINSQKVGNCWIKQPMRGLLASLYIECISARPALTPERAWDEALKCYKAIQKDFAIPFVAKLLHESKLDAHKKSSAQAALEAHKSRV